MYQSIPPIALGVVLVLVLGLIVMAVSLHKLNKKLKKFMVGKNASSLETTLAWLTQKSASVDNTLESHKEALEIIDRRVKKSIRGYSLVRYDAYESVGGEQSFASGLIDEHEDGYILSVITNRNHVGVYAKKINRGIPELTLTKEETEALNVAKKSLT